MRLTAEQTEQVVAAIGAALKDDALTVDELGEAVVSATGSWAGDLVMPAFQQMWPPWRQAVGAAARRGVLCHGPDRGGRGTYASPQRWLPGFQPVPAGEATVWLVSEYLRAYGPSTPEYFARWLSAPVSWAERAFELAKGLWTRSCSMVSRRGRWPATRKRRRTTARRRPCGCFPTSTPIDPHA